MISRAFSPKPVTTEKTHITARTVNVKEVLNFKELFSASFSNHVRVITT